MYNISQVKSCITSEMVCDILGLSAKKNEICSSGRTTFILCPDHPDVHPNSCKLTEHGYQCFRCGAYGSQIDLYAKKKNISFSKAIYELGSLLKLEQTDEKFEPSPLTEIDKEALGMKSLSYLKKMWITNKEAYNYALNKLINERIENLTTLLAKLDRSSPSFKDVGIYNSEILFKMRNNINNQLIHLEGMKDGNI